MAIVRYVSQQEVDQAFEEHNVWHRIRTGQLKPVPKPATINEQGETSQIVKYYALPEHRHLCTVHWVWARTGREKHCHAKDIVLPSGEKLCLPPPRLDPRGRGIF